MRSVTGKYVLALSVVIMAITSSTVLAQQSFDSFEDQSAGAHSVLWDASSCAAGIYIYRIQADGFSDSGRMSYIK